MADVLTDAKSFRWKDLDLAGNLMSWNDRIGMRLAVHQYLKRDGAEVEPMGAEPGRFTMRLCFLGENWAKQYRALVATIRKDPRGQMVHPLLGTMNVACEGIPDASVVPGQERDSINLTIVFVEDQVDAQVLSDDSPGPAARKAKIVSIASQVSAISQAAAWGQTAVNLTTAAISFAVAAESAAASLSDADVTLDGQLGVVATSSEDAEDAIADDSTYTTPAASFVALSVVEQLYAECLDMLDAVAATKPLILTYTVPAQTDVASIAARLYGKDGLGRMDEILVLNRIANPYAIPAGTVLQVATPTI